jgi:predicted amidohydrolase YtcJ
VITNGVVWTGVERAAPARAVAVKDGRIAAVGSAREIERWVGEGTTVVDAKGGLVAPGFIDTHVHFVTGGFGLASVQLRDARTPGGVRGARARLRPHRPRRHLDHQRRLGPRAWGGELPTREWIDSVSPNHPVWVNRLDGHMALANSAALRAAGVTAATPEVEGGSIVRDAAGEPTGILKDNAMALVARVVPDPRRR